MVRLSEGALKEDILTLLHACFENFRDVGPAPDTLHFFSGDSGLAVRDLIYLIDILEERYHIIFCVEDFDDPDFYTLGGLAHCLAVKLAA